MLEPDAEPEPEHDAALGVGAQLLPPPPRVWQLLQKENEDAMDKCTLILNQPIIMGLRCPSENTMKTLNSLLRIACYGLEGATRLDANTKHCTLST